MSNQPYIILTPIELKVFKDAVELYGSIYSFTHAVYVGVEFKYYRVYINYKGGKSKLYPDEALAALEIGKLIGRIAQRYPKRYPHYKIF